MSDDGLPNALGISWFPQWNDTEIFPFEFIAGGGFYILPLQNISDNGYDADVESNASSEDEEEDEEEDSGYYSDYVSLSSMNVS